MTIEADLISIIKKAFTLKIRDIHFIVKANYHVAVRYRSGHVMPEPDRYLSLGEYKSLIGYVKRHTIFDPFDPIHSKLQLPQSGNLVINDGSDYLLKCRVSLLPTKKYKSLILCIMQK